MSRKRQKKLQPESMKSAPKSTFQLPKFFRMYPEEDIPDELQDRRADDWSDSESEVEDTQFLLSEGLSLSGLDTATEEEPEPDKDNEVAEEIKLMQ